MSSDLLRKYANLVESAMDTAAQIKLPANERKHIRDVSGVGRAWDDTVALIEKSIPRDQIRWINVVSTLPKKLNLGAGKKIGETQLASERGDVSNTYYKIDGTNIIYSRQRINGRAESYATLYFDVADTDLLFN